MKKRRHGCISNYSPLLKHSQIHERFLSKTRNIHDSKGRSSKRSYNKFQQKNKNCSDTPCLKKDAFYSLESLFELKKILNLKDVYFLAFNHKEKSTKEKSIETLNITRSEPIVETLFLQSFSPRANLEQPEPSFDEYLKKNKEKTNNEIKTSKVLETEVSDSVQELQKNELTDNRQNLSENMAENEEVWKVQVKQEKPEEQENESKPENDAETMETPEEDVKEATDDKKIEDDYKDEKDKIDDKAGGDLQDEEISKEPEITFLLTDEAIAELKEMDKRCVILADEIQQLKHEVVELSEKPELTEEDSFMIQDKQNVLMSKIAELNSITQKLHKTRQQMFKEMENLKLDIVEEKKEVIEKKERDIEPFLKFLEEDFPQVEYPENKLPRVIVCDYTETDFPKILLVNNEQKEREKCLEKLTGKLTESLTMQEKLVEENVQLEGGKYKLEQALLEKDTAVESLQKKICDLQTEVRIVVKENKALKQTVASLNQRVSRSTCSHTCPGVISSSPSTPLVSPRLYVSAQPRDDFQCPQAQIAGILSPLTETVYCSSRLTGGGSKTEDQHNNPLQNKEMCSRGPAVVKPFISGGIYPAELEDKFVSCSTSTKQLKQQLDTMESKVHNMQMELANVQRERQQLHQQRKLLKCTGPCAPCACCPSTPTTAPGLPVTSISSKGPVPAGAPIQVTAPIGSGSFTNATMGPSTQQQLSDLREQYARLQDDYKSKLCEVSCMRTEAERLKQELHDANEEKERMEIKLIDAQERLKLLETEKNKYEGLKEQLIDQEQDLKVTKQRFRESQDELEELRSLNQEQAAQLESYRTKYLHAQEQVEEQRRQLDLMEMDNARMNENVTLEIGRVKNQFQEKLAELAPLPDMLKQMQMKMQEAQQMRLVAERNCEDLSRELLGCKDQIQSLQNELDVLRTEHQTIQNEREKGSNQVEEIEKKCSELRHENERMKNTLARNEEHRTQMQKSIDEKMHENAQLSSMLEQMREDSARQVARTKERCETMRKTMQGQVAEMERQLAQCRATARAAQRDRDEIRQKMQGQINNLNEAFKHAQGRIKSLQGHVNYLKTSYSNIFLGQGETPTGALATVLPGDESCDCNY